MNDNCLSAGGRGYGGCAILWKSSTSCTVEAVVIQYHHDNNVNTGLQTTSCTPSSKSGVHEIPRPHQMEALLTLVIW